MSTHNKTCFGYSYGGKKEKKNFVHHFCHLPEKGTKETEEIVGKMKETDREEMEEIKTFLSTKPCRTVSQHQLDTPVHKIHNTFAIPNYTLNNVVNEDKTVQI